MWVLVYGNEHLKLPKSTMLWGVVIAALIGLVTIPFYGALSDRVGRRPLYLGGALFALVFAVPFFWLVNTKAAVLIWLAIVLGVNVGHDLMYGPQAAFFSELFGTTARYTGVSVGAQLSSLVAGAPAPLIAVALLGSFTDPNPSAVALYLLACAAVTLIAVFAYGETRSRDLAADHAVVTKPGGREVETV